MRELVRAIKTRWKAYAILDLTVCISAKNVENKPPFHYDLISGLKY